MRATFADERSASGGDPVTEIRDLLKTLVGDSLAGNRPYFLTVTRALLDGMPVRDWPGGNPAADALVRLLLDLAPAESRGWDERARAYVAVITALITGWILLEDQLLDIVHLPPSRRAEGRELLLDTVDAIIEDAVDARPTAGDASS